MPDLNSYDYAVIRVVPRVEREEFINAGVILFCLERRILHARVEVNQTRLLALWPAMDVNLVRERLEAFRRICAGDLDAGPIAQLSQRERFAWLTAPRSTIIQVSPVHSGLCESPERAVDVLFAQLVQVDSARYNES